MWGFDASSSFGRVTEDLLPAAWDISDPVPGWFGCALRRPAAQALALTVPLLHLTRLSRWQTLAQAIPLGAGN